MDTLSADTALRSPGTSLSLSLDVLSSIDFTCVRRIFEIEFLAVLTRLPHGAFSDSHSRDYQYYLKASDRQRLDKACVSDTDCF